MSANSKIEWTDTTWNPVVGCTRVSQGCKLCYWMPQHDRRHRAWKEGRWDDAPAQYHQPSNVVQTMPDRLDQPMHWRKPRMIFVNSVSDLFHEKVPFAFIDQIFAVMAQCPRHTFQILTKRPERMREYCSRLSPLSNVWLGTSVEDQKAADVRIPHLLATPAAVRFLSCEPLLGPVWLTHIPPINPNAPCVTEALTGKTFWPDGDSDEGPRIDWIICGGESGPGARALHPRWARSLHDQCIAAGVPFFFKQWGEWLPSNEPPFGRILFPNKLPRIQWGAGAGILSGDGSISIRVGKKAAGRLLGGREHNALPK